jgi:hypothetical protein
VHPADGAGHDHVRAQGRDGLRVRRARRTDRLDVGQCRGAPGQRHAQAEQQRADSVVGGHHAAEGGR